MGEEAMNPEELRVTLIRDIEMLLAFPGNRFLSDTSRRLLNALKTYGQTASVAWLQEILDLFNKEP
jgi:hypothetical protein